MNFNTRVSRIERVKIQYEFLPEYCKKCMLQGHNEVECRILHPKLKQVFEDKKNKWQGHNHKTNYGKDIIRGQQKHQQVHDKRWYPTRKRFPDK